MTEIKSMAGEKNSGVAGGTVPLDGRHGGRSSKHKARSSSGAALVIVLGFVVLLTVLVVAFFSRAISERGISNSSASQTKAEIFAQGAADFIIDDLKQEIASGSNATTTTGGTIYTPTSPANAVPALVGSSGTNGLENLIKRSASGLPFYTGGISRASSASTTSASQNSRSISLARWNKPLFMPPTSPSNLEPAASVGFTAPDWIFVGRDGSNPTAVTTDPTAANYAVGRYAYAIYDEGGLLDVNVAGYPSTTGAQSAYKPALSYADLTQVGLTAIQVDKLVAWRNWASTQAPGASFFSPGFTAASATKYSQSIRENSTGFLRTSGAALHNGQSDRMFTSRQQLISFLKNGLGLSANSTAFQYLGTFSRDINQPSLSPDPARPKIVSGNGGNDAYGGDDVINPSFLSVRTNSAFTRNDGSAAISGEPLVKKRFPLNFLAWLTYKGPSATRNQSDVDIQALINPWVSWNSLQLGTAANIQAYFGLTWDAANSQWIYGIHNGGSGRIKTLSQVAAAGREPNFIELLKASIVAGSLGKGATNPGGLSWEVLQYNQDISVDYAIVQIAANIIDQFDTDGYPCRISFDGGVGPKEFVGVENLPYFYRTRTGLVMLRGPNPYPDRTTGANTFAPQDYYGVSRGMSANTTLDDGLPAGTLLRLTDPGMIAVFLQPEVWNPHDAKCSVGAPRPNTSGSAELRLVVDSSLDLAIYWTIGQRSVTATPFIYSSSAVTSGTDPSPAFYNNYQPNPLTLSADNTALNFSDNGGALFREPTLLVKPDKPAGSQLSMDSSNQLATIFSGDPLLSPYLQTASNGSPCVKAVNYKNELFCGVFLGVTPMRWVTGSGTVRQVISGNTMAAPFLSNGDAPTMYRLQYKDQEGAWRTYDQKITHVLGGGNGIHWSGNFHPAQVIGQVGFASCIDPRSSRFGMPAGSISGQGFYFPPYSLNYYQQDPETFLDPTGTVITTNRLDANAGDGLALQANTIPPRPRTCGLPFVSGWYPNNWAALVSNNLNLFRFGLFSQNDPAAINNGTLFSSYYRPGQYLTPTPQSQYYSDPDGVVRRAMAAYVPATSSSVSADTVVGLPLATATTFNGTTPAPAATQSQSRPVILNRPFQSVADLGYVFSGTAWKQLDMATPESGCAGLLDVFCVRASNDFDGVEAGRVNLNTRQAPVLKAILAGAMKDEFTSSPSSISAEAGAIAAALVARTTSTAVGKGPLGNLSELVGKWTGSVPLTSGGIDGAKSFSGFSADLAAIYGTGTYADPASNNIQRLRGASLRALANTGTVRVWTIMIDLVAQTGRFAPKADSPDKFIVEGEQRYWVHVAIDRRTGEVIDKQVEVVKE
jgi:Tfp pilus assembly protein PilX